MPVFTELSTLTDVEIDDMISALRSEIKLKGVEASLVNVTRYNWVNGYDSSWVITATFLHGVGPVSSSSRLLHDALNSFLGKIKTPPNLAQILGYEEVK